MGDGKVITNEKPSNLKRLRISLRMLRYLVQKREFRFTVFKDNIEEFKNMFQIKLLLNHFFLFYNYFQ